MSENSNPEGQQKRKRSSEREDAFNVVAWLAEGAAGIASELKNSDLGLGQDFWSHSSSAKREGLLAMRALLDQIIERSEAPAAQEEEREQRRERRGSISIG